MDNSDIHITETDLMKFLTLLPKKELERGEKPIETVYQFLRADRFLAMDYAKFVEDKSLPEAKHCIPSHSLSLRFNGEFPGEHGLAGFTGAKDDGRGGNNCSCKSCKAPVNIYINMRKPTLSILETGCPSCCPTNSVKASTVVRNV